jgi:hypothetical protein
LAPRKKSAIGCIRPAIPGVMGFIGAWTVYRSLFFMDATLFEPTVSHAQIRRQVNDIIALLAERAAYAEDAEYRQIRDLIAALRRFEQPVR